MNSAVTDTARSTGQPPKPTFIELFTPKLVTVLREGYDLTAFRADVVAGLTVAIVALPLSMAIAIASGVSPDRGLYTAIVGGFIVSLLGGSRFQIGGPAGAFIVLIAATGERHGIDGLILATMMAGAMLVVIGLLRLGTYVKYIPYPVTVGFTAGIAVIIFTSQLRDLFGLQLPGKEPAAFLPKIEMLAASTGHVNLYAIGVSVAAMATIIAIKKWRPHWPSLLIAVGGAGIIVALAGLPVETIGSRFGGIPHALPAPALPAWSMEKMRAVLPDAFAFALLGAIESLLSAVVADGMTGRRHRSNCELVAQGFANMASGLFGGICVTGTIARTATNVRSGARGPISGMLHALFLLVFMVAAGSLASYIPLAALAAVLAIVAWDMADKNEFWMLVRYSPSDALIVLSTFLLSVFRDLTEGILVGFIIGAVVFIHRMAQVSGVQSQADRADRRDDGIGEYDSAIATDPDVVIYRISGAFFFGAASAIGAVLDGIADHHRNLILDFSAVPLLDSSGANTVHGILRKAQRHGVRLFLTGTNAEMRRVLVAAGLKPPRVIYKATIEDAADSARARDSGTVS